MRRLLLSVSGLAVLLGVVAVNALPPGTEREISQRLQPVGSVNRAVVAETAAAPAVVEPLSGDQVYDQYCSVCHAAGVGGAPLFADTGVWAPRIAKGMDVLMDSTINGIGAMPAKGTCMSCSDDELSAAVTYMVDAAQ
ncbi:MAG: c-type cytochrome [Pseudomonadota bacterium]|nr:c-type cytochrome [Pseudomonadota bacterium]MEC7662726.1 c-type cytochrome [Pseudomonadota bacterium]MEC7976344.1 c-type cytochrome [Pseudomonadota bacterium]GIR64001.1 MAG: hypothetical protein CM15mP68_6670 [Pseudomonadota bacterium]